MNRNLKCDVKFYLNNVFSRQAHLEHVSQTFKWFSKSRLRMVICSCKLWRLTYLGIMNEQCPCSWTASSAEWKSIPEYSGNNTLIKHIMLWVGRKVEILLMPLKAKTVLHVKINWGEHLCDLRVGKDFFVRYKSSNSKANIYKTN